MSTTQFDTVIIGTGQSGKPLGIALARSGLKVAVIEREHVGGTCINVGCTPTKTMVASARVAYLARRAKDYGVSAGPVTVDMRRVYQRKRRMVESFRNYGQKTLEKTANLELIFGEARFRDSQRVVVELKSGGTRELEGKRIVINTGGRPAVPTIPGLDRIPFLDSSSIMELTDDDVSNEAIPFSTAREITIAGARLSALRRHTHRSLLISGLSVRQHARYDARSRSYRYRVWRRRERSALEARRSLWYPRPLDLTALNENAASLVGEHDFRAFTPAESQHRLFTRSIESETPPVVRQSAGKTELLVPIRLTDGKAKFVLEYAW